MGEEIRVEVAYALQTEQVVLPVRLPAGATIAEAIQRSGMLLRYPEIDLRASGVGVYGKLAQLDHPLRDGDRVEVYRPLTADPKEARRRRAAERKRE